MVQARLPEPRANQQSGLFSRSSSHPLHKGLQLGRLLHTHQMPEISNTSMIKLDPPLLWGKHPNLAQPEGWNGCLSQLAPLAVSLAATQ